MLILNIRFFRMNMCKLFVCILVLFCATFSVFPQQPDTPINENIIKQAVTDLTPIAGKPTVPFAFTRMVTLAMALEQTHAWKSPATDHLSQLLPNAPNKQCFAALQQLLADGDTAGAVALREQVRTGSIPSADLTAGIQLLQKTGFKLASDKGDYYA